VETDVFYDEEVGIAASIARIGVIDGEDVSVGLIIMRASVINERVGELDDEMTWCLCQINVTIM
jgi:hypothetical protein